jgi:outer membrane protein, heavy metal efflux system
MGLIKLRLIRFLVFFPLLVAPLSTLFAQGDHEALEKSISLTFAVVFEDALQNTPEFMELEVREAQADAFSDNGNSWTAGRPSLQFNYFDDGLLDNTGMKELEYAIQLPLWRPGERSDVQKFGQNMQVQVDMWKSYLSLSIAGKLRSVLADLTEAETLVEIDLQAIKDAQQLLDVSESLFGAGEISQLEVMQAQSQLLEQQKNGLLSEAMLVDAEREYEVLTGLSVRPGTSHHEELIIQEEISASHPHLLLLQSQIDLMESNIRQTEIAAKGSPILSLGSRHERGSKLENYGDSVSVSLNIPIGGKSLISSKTTTARRDKVDAEVVYQNTLRRLNQELHEVEHELFLTNQKISLSEEQKDLSERRRQMAFAAFELGETSMTQVVLALQQLRIANRDYQTNLLSRERLITEFNQVIGVLP